MANVRVTDFDESALLNDPETSRAVRQATETGKIRSEAITPIDTGRLVKSLETDYEMTPRGLTGRWGSDVDYAPHVEYGHVTSSGSHVPAQPFLRSAAASLRG